MTVRRLAMLAPLALAPLLGACGGGSAASERAYCPSPLVVQDAARLTHFRDGTGRDPRDIAYEATLAGASTSCELGRGRMDVTLQMRIAVSAGPSVSPGVTGVPFFVRVIDAGGSVLQGQEFVSEARLSPGTPRAVLPEEVQLRLPFEQLSDIGGYRIAIGLKPTREELDYNRRAAGRP